MRAKKCCEEKSSGVKGSSVTDKVLFSKEKGFIKKVTSGQRPGEEGSGVVLGKGLQAEGNARKGCKRGTGRAQSS